MSTVMIFRFDSVVKKFAAQFQADFTYSLIVRLHHNVVKTAVISDEDGMKVKDHYKFLFDKRFMYN